MTAKEILKKYDTYYCIFTPDDATNSVGFREFIAQFINAGLDERANTKRVQLLLDSHRIPGNKPGTLIMVPISGKIKTKRCNVTGFFNFISSGKICKDDGMLVTKAGQETSVKDIPDTICDEEYTPFVGFTEFREGDRF